MFVIIFIGGIFLDKGLIWLGLKLKVENKGKIFWLKVFAVLEW